MTLKKGVKLGLWWATVGLWVALFAAGIAFSIDVLEHTSPDAVKGYDGGESKEVFRQYFPQYAGLDALFLHIAPTNHSHSVPDAYLDDIVARLRASIHNGRFVHLVAALYARNTLSAENATYLASLTESSRDKSVFVLILTDESASAATGIGYDTLQLAEFLQKEIRAYPTNNGAFRLSVVGMASELKKIQTNAQDDLFLVEIIVPYLLCILVVCSLTASVFFPVIFFALLIVWTLSLVVIRVVAGFVVVHSSIVPILIATALALVSIYTLIVLSRFSQYASRGCNSLKCAKYAFSASLMPIGFTTAAFLTVTVAALFCGQAGVLSFSLCLLLESLMCGLLAITFIPSVLSICRTFFFMNGIVPCSPDCRKMKVNSEFEEADTIRASSMYKFLAFLTRRRFSPLVITIVVLGVLGAILGFVGNIKISYNMSVLLTDDLSDDDPFAQFAFSFNPGYLSPYAVLHESNSEQPNIFTDQSFVQEAFLTRRMIQRFPFVSSEELLGVSYFSNTPVSKSEYPELLRIPNTDPKAISYNQLVSHILSPDHRTVANLFMPKESPHDLSDIVPSFNELALMAMNSTPDKFYLVGRGADIYNYANDFNIVVFALVAGISFVVLCALLSGSIFTPLRLLCTAIILLTCTVTFLEIVVQNVSVFTVLYGSLLLLCWGMSFPANLYTSALRIRNNGFDSSSSVLRAFHFTWKQNVAIPLIIIVSFFPLLFSATNFVAQIALLHVIACVIYLVLFVMIFDPVNSVMWETFNWYPRRRPIIFRTATAPQEGSQFLNPVLQYLDPSTNSTASKDFK